MITVRITALAEDNLAGACQRCRNIVVAIKKAPIINPPLSTWYIGSCPRSRLRRAVAPIKLQVFSSLLFENY
jgi:hypothetical protein